MTVISPNELESSEVKIDDKIISRLNELIRQSWNGVNSIVYLDRMNNLIDSNSTIECLECLYRKNGWHVSNKEYYLVFSKI